MEVSGRTRESIITMLKDINIVDEDITHIVDVSEFGFDNDAHDVDAWAAYYVETEHATIRVTIEYTQDR